ncbi:lipopolysaccharide biosynthesis protein [Aureivirga sp. CE67]|uniref:lipopolysaccharide biosynthesis protein n=1 Tax=Aureivirga sp. CE67 TaxID=1788983 RepID=UPI0018CA7C5E|nr:oligosaccharide flippase family protein [Aureivirga sp. CE67]
MSVVLSQSFRNTLILFLGFAIGGINTLFLYTHFIDEDYYGLVTFLFSAANLILPLVVFGTQHTIIKFFSSFSTKEKQDQFLSFTLLMPLFFIIPLGLIGTTFYNGISTWISSKNAIIKNYSFIIFFSAIFMGYFEVFYAWTKVKLKSVFGNFVKEIFHRVCATILLFLVYFKVINEEQFVLAMLAVYFFRMLIMIVYALIVYTPKFNFTIPDNVKQLFSYSFFIIVAGSAGSILLEIDKVMIPQLIEIEEVAYYSVAIYIGSVVGIPLRAMQQIITPLTAKALNNNDNNEVERLYHKSSINLLVVGGLLFLLINLNILDMYKIINKPSYTEGIWVVLIISIAKLFDMLLGTNKIIIANSKYYRLFFYISVGMALTVIVFNRILIAKIGNDGAALATLITNVIFGIVGIVLVKRKFGFLPFTSKTWISIACIVIAFLGFSQIPNDAFTFIKDIIVFDKNISPVLSIIIRSILVSFLYLVVIYSLKLSLDLNKTIQNIIQKRKLF